MPQFEDRDRTMIAQDKLLDIDTKAEEENMPDKEYFNQFPPAILFREGINDRLLALGYSGAMDDAAEKVQFIQELFKKNGVEPVSKATLDNWMVRKDKNGQPAPPSLKQPDRENIFRLCFALEMNREETAEFILKHCLSRPFNYKNSHEAVYYYCLGTGKSYSDAQRLIARVEKACTGAPTEILRTEMIGSDIAALRQEDDLVDYLVTHTYSKEQWHSSARAEIAQLLEKCKVLAQYDRENLSSDDRDGNACGTAPKVQGNDRLLNIIYGFKASVRKGDGCLSVREDYDFPDALRDNWVSKQSISDVLNGKNISDEVYRKTLMILSFYHFYTDLYSKEDLWQAASTDVRDRSDEFEEELDNTLNKCGYIQLYKRNPFDWIILYCAMFPDPLEQFRSLIAHFLKDSD